MKERGSARGGSGRSGNKLGGAGPGPPASQCAAANSENQVAFEYKQCQPAALKYLWRICLVYIPIIRWLRFGSRAPDLAVALLFASYSSAGATRPSANKPTGAHLSEMILT